MSVSDMSARTLDLSLEAPEVIRPRRDVDVPVRIAGLARGEQAMLTLAAVDEGVLRLTKFASPDPAAYFFGKRRLALALRDDYSRMLDANLGAADALAATRSAAKA